uniref:Uncharacterized protein n=1 Tax=Anguilla anguilla TaxID=7936 RepID=A0A0E9WGP3_ANGAN
MFGKQHPRFTSPPSKKKSQLETTGLAPPLFLAFFFLLAPLDCGGCPALFLAFFC